MVHPSARGPVVHRLMHRYRGNSRYASIYLGFSRPMHFADSAFRLTGFLRPTTKRAKTSLLPVGPPSAADAILRTVCHPHPPATRFRSHGLRALPATLQTRPRHTPTQHARRVQKPTVFVAGVGLIIDVDSSAVNLHCMVKSTPKTFEPEVVQVDDFWVHVAVSRDAHLSKRFQCEVSLYPREADSRVVRPRFEQASGGAPSPAGVHNANSGIRARHCARTHTDQHLLNLTLFAQRPIGADTSRRSRAFIRSHASRGFRSCSRREIRLPPRLRVRRR